MDQIRYRVPYRVTVVARDTASGKAVTNAWYYRCGVQESLPPAYNTPVAGASLVATFLSNFITTYEAEITPLLSHNYTTLLYTADSLVSVVNPGQITPITGLGPSGPVTIVYSLAPHGLVGTPQVTIAGVTTPAAINGNYTATVVADNAFTLPVAWPGGLWTNDGYWTLRIKKPEWGIGDRHSAVPVAGGGGIAGDAMTLFSTVSARRLNTGAGRHFRSRLSLSPLGETQNLDGALTPVAFTAFKNALHAMADTNEANGGSSDFSNSMQPVVVSKAIAATAGNPITSSDSWCINITDIVPQPNLGSLVRRKPRLTSAIT